MAQSCSKNYSAFLARVEKYGEFAIGVACIHACYDEM